MAHKRAEERSRARQEERSRARQEECSRAQLAAWKSFMQAELRGLEQRKDGQLARLLGQALPGEPPATLQRLASEDRRQAEEGLVALMRNGKVFYKHVERGSPKRTCRPGSRPTGCGRRGSRSGKTGGLIMGTVSGRSRNVCTTSTAGSTFREHF